MAHISKKKIDKRLVEQLDKNITNLLQNTGSQTRTIIIGELLTKTEQIMLAKRIGVLLLLKKGLSPYKISEILGVSPSTAERFQQSVSQGKYRNTINWIWKQSSEGVLNTFLESLARLAFTRRTKSFKKFVDEY